MRTRRIGLIASLSAAALLGSHATRARATEGINSLQVGDTAQDYVWQTIDGAKITLSELTRGGPVVLVVLRGYPGYQCPICTRQVSDLRDHAGDFQRLGARVVLVYPGPAKELKQRAEEFLEGIALPDPMTLVLDPDYSFTNLYGLRWEAPNETSYPSTFVLDPNRIARFVKISTSHGDRADTAEVLAVVEKLQAPAATEEK
jgi:peroxiredoxin